MKLKLLLLNCCILCFGLFGCAQKDKVNEKQDGEEVLASQEQVLELISPAELNPMLGLEIQLIDVRTEGEFASGAIAGAKNINFNEEDFLERMDQLNKDQPVYLYCRSGRRSNNAARQLKDKGFTKVYDLKGGILAWQKEKLPLQ